MAIPFDPDAYIAKYIQPKPSRLAFKDPQVESEFEQVSPALKEIAAASSVPLTITSGKRSIAQNSSVGGVPHSYHTTGNAIDIRKDVPYEQIAAHFEPKGYEIINESDHYHVEPKKGAPVAPAPFDPDAYIKKYGLTEMKPPELPPIAPPSAELVKQGIARKYAADPFAEPLPQIAQDKDPNLGKLAKTIGRGFRSFSKAATGGLSEPLSNIIASPIATDLIKSDPNLNTPNLFTSAVEGEWKGRTDNDKLLGETYKKIKKNSRESLQKGEQESPVASTVGTVGGYVAPGALFGELYKGAKGLTAIPNITAEAVPYLAKIIQAGATGGLANLGQQGIETVSDRLSDGNREFTPVKDFLTGAAFDAGGSLVGEGANKTYQAGKKFFNPERIQRLVEEEVPFLGKYLKRVREDKLKAADEAFLAEKEAADSAYQKARDNFKQQEAAKKSQYSNDVAELNDTFRVQEEARQQAYQREKEITLDNLREVSKVDDITAGTNLGKKASEADLALSKEYASTVDPIIKRYSLRTISPNNIRKKIVNILKPQGLVDNKGNFIPEELENIIAPERRKMMERLISISEKLQKNPTVRKMNQIVQDFQSLANFDAPTRSAEEKIFGSLAREAKEAFLDGLETVAKGDDFQKLKQAREKFSQAKPVIDSLKRVTRGAPEKVVKGASNQFQPSIIKETIARRPEMKEAIGDVLVNNIIQRGTNPKALSKAIDSYGRDTLKELLNPEQYESLLRAEKRFLEAAKPYKGAKAPLPLKFKPGQAPIKPNLVKPKEVIPPAYHKASNFFNNRNPGRLSQHLKYLAPYLSTER